MSDQLTMDEIGFTPDDILEGEQTAILGPAYFAARRIAENVTAKLAPGALEAIIKKASDDLYATLLEATEDSLVFDTESNVQGKVWRLVDDTVNALLTGKGWALERYPLAKYRDGKDVREAIFAQCADRMENMRIAELEEEVANLKQRLEWARH